MSVNICSTVCPSCRIWNFADTPLVPRDDAGLMTIDQYLDAVESHRGRNNHGHGYGHGFRQYEDHTSYIIRKPGVTTYTWQRPDDMTGVEVVEYHYEKVYPSHQYRWKKAECPICRTLYALWLRAVPGELSPKVVPTSYECYDLSYYHAFNDEPSKLDEARTIVWDKATVIAACEAYAKAHGLVKEDAK